ncbi:MAG: (2Fe-2S)-binding protein [Caldisericaceae bacterium]
MKEVEIHFTLNGEEYNLTVPANLTLLQIIRERIGLTGTKRGCGKGECGACTVIFNGKSVNSCLVLAPKVDESEVLTVEGIGTFDHPHPIQEAFVEEGAVQCGFCTPGFVVSSYYLLSKNPHPSEEEIREGLSGNLCRCTGYIKIINALKKASEKLNG